MGAMWAIAKKDIRLLVRDRMGFFFAFVFPIMTAIFFGTIFGSGGGGAEDGNKIDVLLVDEDGTEGSKTFATTLKGATELGVTDAPDRAEAMKRVAGGKATAFVVLPKGFGAARESLFYGSGSTIVLGVDPSRRAESGMLEGVLTKYGFMQMQDAFQKPEVMQKQVKSSLDALKQSPGLSEQDKATFSKFFDSLDQFLVDVPRSAGGADGKDDANTGPGGWQPLKIEKADVAKQSQAKDGPSNPYAVTFAQGMVWGFIGCTMSFAVGLVLERTKGTLPRLRVAPLNGMQVLAGKALACFAMTQVVVILLMLVARLAFKVEPVSWARLAAAMISAGWCFVGLMLLCSVLSKSERAAAGLGWGTMLIFSMIGGGMIPLFLLQNWMKTLSMVSPVRWTILALESGIWRPVEWGDMLLPCGVLLAIGTAGFIAGAMVFGNSEND